jgi:AraC-like DNA-binding protein
LEEVISFRPVGSVPGAALLTARGTTRRYTWVHECYAVCASYAAPAVVRYRRGEHEHHAGGIFLAEPGETHSAPRIDGRLSFDVVHIPASFVVALARENSSSPHWRNAIEPRSRSFELVRAAARAVASDDILRVEESLLSLVVALLEEHSERRSNLRPRADARLRRVREQIEERLSEAVRLDDLAGDVGLSKEYLVRSFASRYGMPPHRYLVHARVNRARALLDAGVSAADVALSCGFVDQSHLSRWFKRIVGATPGCYQRACATRTFARRKRF